MNDYFQNPDNNLYLNDYREKTSGDKKFLDRRTGYSFLFNFCPLCGKKIDWHILRKDVDNG